MQKEDASLSKATLGDYLSKMESKGGTIQCMFDDDDGSVDALFLLSANMRKKFLEYNPYVKSLVYCSIESLFPDLKKMFMSSIKDIQV